MCVTCMQELSTEDPLKLELQWLGSLEEQQVLFQPTNVYLVFYQIYKIQRGLIDNLSDPAGRGAFLSTTESTFVLVVVALVPNAQDLAYRR